MGFFDRFRGWEIESLAPPWGEGRPILARVEADPEVDLANEPDTPAGVRFAAGARDGIFSHHGPDPDDDPRVKQLADALLSLLSHADEAVFRDFYAIAIAEPVLPIADVFIDEVIAARSDADRFGRVALRLVRESPDVEAVKLGLAMLGVLDDRTASIDATIGKLARHEELTLFALTALRGREAPERTVFDIARAVHGWGRIHAVETLAQTKDREIKRWMLREGYRNAVMVEYTALTCATGGGLAQELAAREVDAELLVGAAEILAALIRGRVAPGIDAYEDAPEALRRFVEHVVTHPPALRLYDPLRAIAELVQTGGPRFVATSLRESLDAYLADPRWVELARDAGGVG